MFEKSTCLICFDCILVFRFLRKTTGIRKMVRIATDQDKTYSARVIKIANQVSKVSVNQSVNYSDVNRSANQIISQMVDDPVRW